MITSYKVVLASNSPRRKELLAGIDIDFEVRVIQDIDESYPADLPTKDIAEYISRKKAAVYQERMADDELIITADTIVVLDNEVMGKPHDEADASRMLHELSGRSHQVITGVTLTTTTRQKSFSVETDVTFKTLSDEEKEAYESQLDIDGSGVMGYIKIDKIGVRLPIYHGTQESVLQTSIGHLEGSSLPVGGESAHCMLSGHRGLPSARLFTDIDKLSVGDTWTLNILDQTLTYEVDQIRVVLPTDLKFLEMEDGKDYCTLVTCTPYGVNTHRLLVRGHRVPNVQGNARVTADALQIEPAYVAPFIGIPIILILIVMLIIATRKKK